MPNTVTKPGESLVVSLPVTEDREADVLAATSTTSSGYLDFELVKQVLVHQPIRRPTRTHIRSAESGSV